MGDGFAGELVACIVEVVVTVGVVEERLDCLALFD